jgi:uncharacterized tellurite resistance protein B-like protein
MLGGIIVGIDFITKNPAILIVPAVGLVIWIVVKLGEWNQKATTDSTPIDGRIEVTVSGRKFARNRSTSDTFASTSRNGDDFWTSESDNAEIGGRRLGGMLYVGTGLAAIGDLEPEPALIDSRLKVSKHVSDCNVRRLDYWPSYTSASPDARAAYLKWLETGRRDPTGDIGYVFLYFYGLERRALHDASSSTTAANEIPHIAKEVSRLLGIYGENRSFVRYAEALLDFMLARRLPAQLYMKAPAQRQRRELRVSDRLALAQCAAEGHPLPAAWAHVWVTTAGSVGTPARRCAAEFERLFAMRYKERFGEGLVLPKNRTLLKLDYRPASPSFHGAQELSVSTDLPDVSVLSNPLHKLDETADKVCDELGRFSRLVGKNPAAAESFDGLVELPFNLWPEKYRTPIESVHEVIKRAGRPAAVPFEKLRSWLPGLTELTRPKLRSLAAALATAGLGMEPDVRFGGGVPALESKVVLFADGDAAVAKMTPAYTAAALTLHLAAAVVAADGDVAEVEKGLLTSQLGQWLHLTESESRRLQAHLRLLLAEPPKLTGLKKRVGELRPAAREALGDFLTQVAQADDKVTPAEIKALQKIFKLLSLDPQTVFSKVHAAATEPISVTAPDELQRPRHLIPREPVAEPAAKTQLKLDATKIAALQRDSERVAGILAAVFEQPPAEEAPEPAPEPEDAAEVEPRLLGLDAIHAALLETLLSRTHWARAELEELAEDRGLLLDGALEHINDASFDNLDMPMFEDGEPLALNEDAVREVLGGHHQEP